MMNEKDLVSATCNMYVDMHVEIACVYVESKVELVDLPK